MAAKMIGLNFVDVVALYEYGRNRLGDDNEYVKAPPTCKSLAAIQKTLGCRLPTDFIEFAKLCESYTTYFSLIGEDVDLLGNLYEPHVILLHKFFPDEYIRLAQPKHGKEIVFHRDDPDGPIYNIQDDFGEPALIEIASSFRHFLENFAISIALGDRNVDSGRKNARILAESEIHVLGVLEKYMKE